MQRIAFTTTAILAGLLATNASATELFNNLGDETAGTRFADSQEWLTAGFRTNANEYDALKVTVLARADLSILLRMELWSESQGHPGFQIDTLEQINSISGSLSEVSFAGTHLNLDPNEPYYIVMHPLAGDYQWAYTEEDTTNASWGTTLNGGLLWTMSSFEPLQFGTTGLIAIPGDTNLDESVNFTDLLVVAQNYDETSGGTWPTGDFNDDDAVDFNDLLALAQNYESAASFESDWAHAQLITSSSVPEPALAGLMFGVISLLCTRQRRA